MGYVFALHGCFSFLLWPRGTGRCPQSGTFAPLPPLGMPLGGSIERDPPKEEGEIGTPSVDLLQAPWILCI